MITHSLKEYANSETRANNCEKQTFTLKTTIIRIFKGILKRYTST
jgi:hypothetical protein